jgi:hypothetical protein
VSLTLSGCAGDDETPLATDGTHPSTTARASDDADDSGTATTVAKPHFDTPEAAMRYLAAAWNANDLVSLKHVTNPSARDELDAMHGVATNLRLNHCDKNPIGDYSCHFDHDYPPHPSTTMPLEHEGKTGEAVFLVGPADTPGWYMTVFESCS